MTTKQLYLSTLCFALLAGLVSANAEPAKTKPAQKSTPAKRSTATSKTHPDGEKTGPLTGSHVKQSYRRQGQITDGANQVVVYDRAMIERSGASSLSDFLRQRN